MACSPGEIKRKKRAYFGETTLGTSCFYLPCQLDPTSLATQETVKEKRREAGGLGVKIRRRHLSQAKRLILTEMHLALKITIRRDKVYIYRYVKS